VLNILFIGDVVASPGREAIARLLPGIREREEVDLTIANVENVVHGRGVRADKLAELQAAGVDGFTLGDHAFWQRDILSVIDDLPLSRPANYPADVPGSGVLELDLGKKGMVLVANMLGIGQMSAPTARPAACPFRTMDFLLDEYPRNRYSAVVVDFHAETTAEKAAFAWYLDGRLSAVLGTHTHVPTADARILPQGTAFVSDVGMVGAYNSVLGVKKDVIIKYLRYPYPERFEWEEEGPAVFNSVLLTVGEGGHTTSIQRVDEITDI